MPAREYKLDAPGFSRPAPALRTPVEPEQRGGGLFQIGENFDNMVEDIVAIPERVGAAFRMENAIVNAIDLISSPINQPDPNFNLEANLKEADLWDDYRWNFVGVDNPATFLDKARKIRQEEADRETLHSAGPDGVVLLMAAGMMDPTILLPFVGSAKGAKAFAIGAGYGMLGGTLQEVPLQLNQELRTLEESGMSVGFSTILGAGLGGAVGLFNKASRNAIDGVDPRMADDSNSSYIPPSRELVDAEAELASIEARHAKELDRLDDEFDDVDGVIADQLDEAAAARERVANARSNVVRETVAEEIDTTLRTNLAKSVGAEAIASSDAGGLKGMLGIGERLTKIAGPVTAVLGQRVSATGRQMMAKLSTAGLRLERNLILDSKGEIVGGIPSNDGGTVEAIVQSRRGDSLRILRNAYERYADYMFGAGGKPGALRATRAYVSGMGKRAGKLNRRQFFEEVGKAMRTQDNHAIPEVQAVAQEFRKFYDELLAEAQELGIISDEIKLLGDLSFLNRVYDVEAINRNPNKFLSLLKDHMNEALQADFAKAIEGFKRAQQRDVQRLADMDLPLAEVKPLREQMQAELKALNSIDNDDEVVQIDELISDLRSSMARISKRIKELQPKAKKGTFDPSTGKRTGDDPVSIEIAALTNERQVYKDEIGNLQLVGGLDLEARKTRKAELKRRLRAFNRNKYLVEEKHRKKFEAIEELEEQNIETMERAIRAGYKAIQAIDGISEDSVKAINKASAEVDKVVDQWVALGNKIDALKEKKGDDLSIENPDLDLLRLMNLQEKQNTKLEKLLAAQEDLRLVQNVDRTEGGVAEMRQTLQDAVDATVEKLSDLNNRRAKRMVKLEEGAGKFDEAGWATKRAEIAARIKDRDVNTRERMVERGADDLDMDNGTADFSMRAKEIAELAMDRIRGTNIRLAGFDAMADKRGTELARTLSIPSEKLAEHDFLVSDAEQLLHAYANTLTPDIELVRRFGPFAPDGEHNEHFRALNEEEKSVLAAHQASAEAKAAKAGKPVDQAKLGEELNGITKEFALVRENLDATMRRIRHQWGIPQDPNGFAARGVSILTSVNALRFLGGVVWSSLADFSKPVFRYGLARTMRAAWVPMISNWKAMRMTAREAQLAFVAVETLTAQRARDLAGLFELARKRSKAEAALEWGTSKIGIIAGFAPWTDLGKTLSSMTLNLKLMDSIDLALNATGSTAARKEAIEFLNSLGMHDDIQRAIWKEMNEGGASKVNGVWVPQTDNWTNQRAVKAYRAALYSEGAASIVTPGVEIPKMMNSSLFGRALFNLKSFAMASTSKTLMYGLQQRDMAVMNGVWISLALGALSYYLKAQIAGGATRARMEAASPQEWMDEAVDQSGILGVLSIAQRISTNVPGLRQITTFSGGSSSKSAAGSLAEDIAGPVGDELYTLTQIITGLEKPSRASIHRVREMLPFQNLFYLRRLFDMTENAVGDKFNLEGQRR